MARRNRIIYPSNSVWANGNVLYRVQTFGSSTTFNTEDVYELGQLALIDVVDDAPTVAVTLETNEFGSVSNLYALANLEQDNVLDHSAVSTSGHLTVVSGLGDAAVNISYYHGVALTEFGLSGCETGSSVEIWAPIQSECSLGTANDDVAQTMFIPRVFINSIQWAYTAGGSATENFGAETDAKFWFVNDGRFISNEEFVYTAAATGAEADPNDGTTGGTGFKINTAATSVFLGLDPLGTVSGTVATRSAGQLAFLRFDSAGNPSVRYFNKSARTSVEIPVQAGTAAVAGFYVYNEFTSELFDPTDLTTNGAFGITEGKGAGDILFVLYAANTYAKAFAALNGTTQAARGGGTAPTSRMSTRRDAQYFAPITIDPSAKPEDVGAVRQGQIEIYLIDKDVLGPDFDRDDELALRLSSVTIAADLTRETLFELSHIRPYDRALTFPIPFTVTVESTANDLVEYATFASKKQGVVIDLTTNEISIYDFMTASQRLDLVVQVYQQNDEEAGGTGQNRRVVQREMVGDEYYQRGQRYLYYDGTASDPDTSINYGTAVPASPTKTNTQRERPLKTVIAKNLRITDEAYSLSVGSNATQSFGFRGTNEIFAVLGEVSVADLVTTPGLQVNPTAQRIV